MNFKDYYKFPLKIDDYCPVKAWTSDHKMAFDFAMWNLKPEKYQKLVDIVNGDRESQANFKVFRQGCEIYLEKDGMEVLFLIIRGWGHLTGIGGLHLPEEKAIEIQNEFGDYIVSRINNVQST